MSTSSQSAESFRALHEGEPFVIPNPWDAGSARMLEELGFKALATTSSGFAFTLGRADGDVTLNEVIAHTEALVRAVNIPVAIDLENGYGRPPVEAARAVAAAADAGAAGGSIEDWDREAGVIYPLDEAAERVHAAVEAARVTGFVLAARAENHIRGVTDLDDTIARLQAYEAAGADVLYSPGIHGDQIKTVCEAVARPVNVLAFPGMKAADIFAAGAQRISVGGQLTWVAAAAAAEAAIAIRDDGDFGPLEAKLQGADWLR
ncbi:MAG TPA: isocitrate lyase/phosphoenolpyruvate mutase family protein [Thermoleophilaceae bacterium]